MSLDISLRNRKRYLSTVNTESMIQASQSKESRLKAVETRLKHTTKWVCEGREDLGKLTLNQLSIALGFKSLITSYFSKKKNKNLRELTYRGYVLRRVEENEF